MSFEKQKTPQEMAQIKKERAISDSELLKGGAEYQIDNEGNEILLATGEQIESAKREMEKDLDKKGIEKRLENMNGEERELFDSSVSYGNLLEESRVLLNEGRISNEEFGNLSKIAWDLNSSRRKELEEKLGTKKAVEIRNLSLEYRDVKNSEMMQNANSFDDLYKAMRRNYDIRFSDGTAKNPNYFVDVIEKVRSGELEINYITRTGGLRSKVEELLKNRKQESVEKEKSSKIEFPQDIKLVKSLQGKLAEYEERLQKQVKENPQKPPELFADTKYKIAILQELLLKGEVDGEKLFKKITSESNEAFDFGAFDNAYAVIEDYAKTGGKNTNGGTGLKVENTSGVKSKEQSEADLKEKISSVKNFDELYKLIENIKGIQGSSEFYSSSELKQRIEGFRRVSGKLGAETGYNMITRLGGLRDKVRELVRKELKL